MGRLLDVGKTKLLDLLEKEEATPVEVNIMNVLSTNKGSFLKSSFRVRRVLPSSPGPATNHKPSPQQGGTVLP
jgi:hypothetical protein